MSKVGFRLFFVALLLSLVTQLSAKELPNIILIMADDQGWGDTGYNGHPHLRTPHLNRMSEEGITFTRFYSAAAMCSPTRVSCYTGRHPYRTGVTYAMKGMLESSEITITKVLKEAGYTTGHFGKWHMGTLNKNIGEQNRWGAYKKNPARYYCPPWMRDVDVCFVTESKVPTWDPLIHPGQIKEFQNDEMKGKPYGTDYFTGPGSIVTENTNGDDSRVIMDRALPFIEGAVAQNQPFFAVIWFHTPHSPVVGGAAYRKMYADHPENEQHYYACLTAMDDQIGRLRSTLDRLDVDENTMLWFCSGNGPARQGSPRHVGSNGGLSGYKLSMQEGGIRVPGLLVWPNGLPGSKIVDAPCVTTDYFPTILDALDIPLPEDRIYDGTSLLPLIRGQRLQRQTPIGFLNKDGQESAWMEDRYKLFVSGSQVRLYDIVNDPAETLDISEERPLVVERMKAELWAWKASVMKELASIPGHQ